MANQYGLFWNSVSGDRTYNADSFAEWANTFFSTGVFNGDLQVTPDSGMVVNVGTGYANINGKVRLFDAQTTFTLSPASGTYPRIDTIVVRRNDTARTITLEYVMGAYSGLDPQPTAPTRDETTYEIVLAQILVNAGATSISVGDITDTRPDDTICGWITGSVDSVDVDQLTAQARAQFDEWFQEMKDQLSEDAAGHLQLEIDDINDSITGINNEIGTTDISGIGDGTVTGAVSALNNGLTYQLFTSFVGSQAVNLPSEFNELYIFASYQSGGNRFNRTMYLIKIALPDTYQYYYSGDSGGRIGTHISKTAIDTLEYYDGSTNRTAQTTFNIYYR